MSDLNTFTVDDAADLTAALDSVAGGTGHYVINIAQDAEIDLTSDLPTISLGAGGSLVINGDDATINGEGHYRGLLAYSGATTINDLTFDDTVAKGGTGGSANYEDGSGGGGAGLGGGLFVAKGATVAISNVNFSHTSAVGGNGGSINGNAGTGGGGGGGMGGNGGVAVQMGDYPNSTGGGGGGGLGIGANGGGTGFSTATNGSPGIAAGGARGGNGGSESSTNHYLFYTETYYSYGTAGGANGGGGGVGYGTGGGGGGVGGADVDNYDLGSFGLDLTFSGPGAAFSLLALADVIEPEVGAALTLAYGLYTHVAALLGSPGYVAKYTSLTVTNAGGFGTQGTGIPTPKVPTYGFGVSLFSQAASGNSPPGGKGGFGGGGGGGGYGSSGGTGGFGGGGGGVDYHAQEGSYYDYYGGSGGFGGGAGGGSGLANGYSAGAPGFGGGYAAQAAPNGGYNLGGGGLGAGGAIFVEQGGQLIDEGGSITDSSVQGGRSALTGAAPKYDGSALGAGVFLEGQASLALAPQADQTVVTGNIADQAGTVGANGQYPLDILVNGIPVYAGSVQIGGQGLVTIEGTNTYLGGTYLAADTLTPPAEGDPYPPGGSKLEIASGATFFGTFYAPGYELLSNDQPTPPTLILDAGVTLPNPIQIETLAGITSSSSEAESNGVWYQFDPTPLIIDERSGGQFTGTISGLLPGQHVYVLGAPFVSAPLEADAGGFLVYGQSYFTPPNESAAVLSNVSNLYAPGATGFVVGDNAQLQSLLTWIPAYDAAATTGAYTIDMDGQIGASVTLGSVLIPTLVAGQSLVFGNTGLAADGSADPAHARVTLTGGSITLNPKTPLTLLGSLEVDSTINGSGGASGLTTSGSIVLGGNNSFVGGLNFTGTLELTKIAAAGAGAIIFGTGEPFALSEPGSTPVGQTLVLDGAALPTNTIANFQVGDAIDLAGISGVSGLLVSDASGALAVGGQTLRFASNLPPNARFWAVADGHGGTDITSLEYTASIASESVLTAGLSFIDGTSSPAPPADADIRVTVTGALTFTSTLGTIDTQNGDRFILLGAGTGETLNGGGHGGLSVAGGVTYVANLVLTGFSGAAITADSGGTVYLDSVYDLDGASIAAGGELVFRSGALDATVSNAGTFDIAPFAGQTASLSAAITGDVGVGDPNAVLQVNLDGSVQDVPTRVGGAVIADASSTVAGTVHILTDTTLELEAGATLGGAGIDFDYVGGGTLQIDGATPPSNVFDLVNGVGEIVLLSVAVASPTFLTLAGDDTLSVPGAGGALHFAGDVAAGESFVMAPDGNGAVILPAAESATVSTEADFDALATVLNGLPANAGVSFQLALSGDILLTHDTPALKVQPGVALSIVDGSGGPGGLTLASGISVSLDGANSFTGGITLGGHDVLTLNAAAAAGAGPLTGFAPGDSIDVAGATLPTGGALYLDAHQDLTLSTASGVATLNLPDQVPGSQFSATSDGHGGVVLTEASGALFVTVTDETSLDQAIATADAAHVNTEIVIAPGTGAITLSHALTALAPQAGEAIFIEGNGVTIDGGQAWGGFVVESGHVGFGDLTIQDTVEQGGVGQDSPGPGGGAGGGAGLGGGLFVGGAATVGLYGVAFSGDSAVGGAGGAGVFGNSWWVNPGAGGQGDVTGGAPGFFGNGTGDFYLPSHPGFYGYGGGGEPVGGAGTPYGGYGGYGGDGGLGGGGSVFVAAGGHITIGGTLSEMGGSVAGGAAGATPSQVSSVFNDYYAGDPDYANHGGALGSGLFANGSATVTLNPAAGQTETFSDDIAGGVGFNLVGAGTAEFDGALSYIGPTTIASGSLVFAGAVGNFSGALTDDGLLTFAATSSGGLSGALSGSGTLIDDSTSTITLSGGLSLAGGATVQSALLRIGGGALSGAIANNYALDLFTSGAIDPSAISGWGDLVYDGAGATTLAGADTDAGALTVESGKLTLAGSNAFSSVTLDGGELALGAGGSAGSAVIQFAAGAHATFTLNAASAPDYIIAGFATGDTIHLADLANPQSVTAVGDTLVVAGTVAGVATTVDLTLSSNTDTSNAVYKAVSDGAGGADIVNPASSYPVASGADLASAISAVAPGGGADRPNIAYDFSFTGPVVLTSPLPEISLASGATLTIDGPVSISDPTAFRSPGSGFMPAANAYALTVGSPGVTIDAGSNPFTLFGVGLDVLSGASLLVEQAGGSAGDLSKTETVVDGSLTVEGNFTFAAWDDPYTRLTTPALSGSGQVTLENGAFTIGDNNGGLSFAGTLALQSATLTVPGYAATNHLSLHELDLYGTSTAQIDTAGVSAIVFEPGATATLVTDTYAPGGTTVTPTLYGVAAGDQIRVVNAFATFGVAPRTLSSVTLSAGNLLSISGNGETFQYQIDPAEDLSGLAISVVGQSVLFQPADYTVATEAQLDAAIKAISAGGSAFGANNHYVITLSADLAGASALQNSLPLISLAAGSTLVIDGQGHMIDGGGHGLFDSSSSLALNDLTLVDSGSGAFQGALVTTKGAVATLGNVAISGGASAGGANVGVNGAIAADPAAGQTVSIADVVTSGSFLLNGPGVLDLSAANSFTGGITIDQGVLELGGVHSAGAGPAPSYADEYGTSSGLVTFAGNGTILADGALPDIVVRGLNSSQGVIHLGAYAPGAITASQGALYGSWGADRYTEITATGDSGALYLDGVTTPVVVLSDGAGGSLIYVARTQLTATDSASLASDLAAFDTGGTQAAAGVGDTVTLAPSGGTIALSTALPSISLLAGTSLTIQGGGATLDGGGQGPLLLAAGSLVLQNVTLDHFANGADLIVAAGASATLNGVAFADTGSGPLIAVGAGASLGILDGTTVAGVIELQGGAALALASSGATPLSLNAAIDDPAGDGTGAGQGSVTVGGSVRLNAVSDFSGGTVVSGRLDLNAVDAAGIGTITLNRGAVLAVESGVLVGNAVTGLAGGGDIDLVGLGDPTGAVFAGNTVTVTGANGSASLNLAEAGLVTQSVQDVLTLTSDSAGGTLVGFAPRTEATASLSATSFSLGAQHATVLAGQPVAVPTATLTVTNTAASGGESVVGTFGTLSQGLTDGGLVSLAPGQSGQLQLAITPSPLGGADGLYSGTANLALTSDGAGGPDAPIALAPIGVTATYYAYASPVVAKTVSLGAARVGDSALTGSISVANGTTSDPYQEGLAYSFSDPNDATLVATSASGTLASGASGSIGLSLGTSQSGAIDDIARVGAVSTGTGTSGLGQTSLGAQAVEITGTVYAKAVAVLPTSVSFGYVHVGDTASTSLAVGDGAPIGGASDDLIASFQADWYVQNGVAWYPPPGAPSGQDWTLGLGSEAQQGVSQQITGQNTSIDIAAGATGALTVSLDAIHGATGVRTVTATVDLTSHDSALADLTLPSQTVTITGTVVNYAGAGLALASGSAGTLTGSGTSYTLDLGDLNSAETVNLSVLNTASGLADSLSGYFTVTSAVGGADFSNSGLGTFSGVAAGGSAAGPSITLTPNEGGAVSETLVLSPTGSNPGGYSGALPKITLTVTANVTRTNYSATSASDLDTIIGNISQGGADAQAGENYTILLTPAANDSIAIASDLDAINLASGSTLTIVGDGSTMLQGSDGAQGLVVQSGQLTLDGVSLAGFTAPSGGAADATVGSAGALTILNGSFGADAGGVGAALASTGGAITFKPASGETIELAGPIGAGAVDLAGAGVLKLDAASAYAGGTTVTGVLDLAAMDAAGTGSITLESGATLKLEAVGTAAAPAVLAATVDGFAGASIDAAGVNPASPTVSLVGDQLTISDGTKAVEVTLAQANLSYYGLTVGSDSAGGTLVSEAAVAPDRAVTAGDLTLGAASFGAVHVGDLDSAVFSVLNTLLQGGDTLVASGNTAPSPLSTSGSLALGPGQNGQLSISFTPTASGHFTGVIPLTLESEDANGVLTPISGVTVNVSGDVYALASPIVTDIGDLGAARIGSSLTGQLVIADGAGSTYQETLGYSLSPYATSTSADQSLDIQFAGGDSGTVAPGHPDKIAVTLTPTNSGVSSYVVPITFTSVGAGSGAGKLADTALNTQYYAHVTGTFYTPAVAQLSGTSIDFGWLHSGQNAGTRYINVSNMAPPSGGDTDTLAASWGSIGGGFVGSGGATGLTVGGGSGQLGVSLQASQTGVLTDTAIVNFASQDALLADLDSTAQVSLTATVTNFADLGLQQVSGGGSFYGQGDLGGNDANGAVGGAGGQYTLDLGDISGGVQSLSFKALNLATGFADSLTDGTVSVLQDPTGATALSGDGLSFDGLGAGQAGQAFTVSIDPTQAGDFSITLEIGADGSNAGGFSEGLGTTLTIKGTVTNGAYAFPDAVADDTKLYDDMVAVNNGEAGGYARGLTGVSYTIDFAPDATVNLTDSLTPINLPEGASLTIDGHGATIDAGGQFGGFWDTQPGSVVLKDLTIANTTADPEYNGVGGGLTVGEPGWGGGLNTSVTLDNVTFQNDSSGYGGLGDDVTVNTGGVLTVESATFGTSSGREGALYVAQGGQVDFTPATGVNIEVQGALTGSGLVTVGGAGTVTLDKVAPVLDWNQDTFNGTFHIAPGATLVLNYDPTNTYSTFVNDGTLVLNGPAVGPAVITGAGGGAYDGLRPADAIKVSYTLDYGYGPQTSSQVIVVGGYALQDVANAFGSLFGVVNANVDSSNPNQIDFSLGNGVTSATLSDAAGHPLEELGLAATVSLTSASPSAVGSQAAVFTDGDTVSLVGTQGEFDLPLGPDGGFGPVTTVGALVDLLNEIGPNFAPGLNASIDAAGHLLIGSIQGEFTLADASGAPLEAIGLTPGTYGSAIFANDISGTGSVVVNATPDTDPVITGAAAWTGVTDVNGGTLTFTGDTSHLTGTIHLDPTTPSTVAFDEDQPDTFAGELTGAGDIVIKGAAPVTFAGSASGRFRVRLDGGTLVVASSGALGSGPVKFAAGVASTLELSPNVALPNTITGVTIGDRIDLAGFDAASTTLSASGGVLTISDADGDTTSLTFSGMDLLRFRFGIADDGAGGAMLTVAARSAGYESFSPGGKLDLSMVSYDPSGAVAIHAGELEIDSGGATYAIPVDPARFQGVSFTTRPDLVGGTMVVASGSTLIQGTSANDRLTGSAGSDVFVGGAGADRLTGDGGGDTYVYNALTDSTVAASGRDTITDFSPANGDKLDLSGLEAAVGETFSFIGASGFDGSPGEIRAFASGSNTLVQLDSDGDKHADFAVLLSGAVPLDASDFLIPAVQAVGHTYQGAGGGDALYGGPGADTFVSGPGADQMTGHGGGDTYVYAALSDSTVAASGRDTLTDFSPTAGDKIDLSQLEVGLGESLTFIGAQPFDGAAGEIRVAASGANTLVSLDSNGDKHADFAIMLDGSVSLTADDFIIPTLHEGTGGKDVLAGGPGADMFVGGPGADILTGGGGQNTYVYETVADSPFAAGQRDTITDFQPGVDKIDLSGLEASAGEDFSFVGAHPFDGAPGEIREAAWGANTMIELDLDGDKHADFGILLDGHLTLAASDFILPSHLFHG